LRRDPGASCCSPTRPPTTRAVASATWFAGEHPERAPAVKRERLSCAPSVPAKRVILRIKWRRFLNAMWRDLSRFADVASWRSAFPSDNHAVRFGALSPGLPDISRVAAHRTFDGHAGRSAIPSHRAEVSYTPDNPQNPTLDNLQNDRKQAPSLAP
jgi:hypothetical protein